MSFKESDTPVLDIGYDRVRSNSNVTGNNSNVFKTVATDNSADVVRNSDFVVSNNLQVHNVSAVQKNEDSECDVTGKTMDDKSVNVEVHSASEVRNSGFTYVSEEGDGSEVYVESEGVLKPAAVHHTGVNSAPWGCNAPSFSDTAVFTGRRDSSSDSVDSESSSSSSSSDWDSSSDTALVSDEDSVRGQPKALPAPCVKPRKVTVPSVKTKGEFTLDDLPPIEDLHISLPEHECKELGKVVSIVDKLVVVEPHRDLPLPTLNLDSVLFLDSGKRAMGHVFDVFGQVKEPLYCVRFNSAAHICDSGVSVGTKVYCAPDTPYTNYVFVNQLLSLRGSDASWEQDNEPPPSVVFFSDDEEEREARRKLRHEKSKLHTDGGGDGSPATQEPKPKRLSLMEERNNRRNLLLNATYSSAAHRGKRPVRGRGWVAPSPDDYIIKPASLSFSADWQPTSHDSHQPEIKPRFPPPPASPAANSPLFGICRPPQFPFTSARFSVPPPLASGKNLFGVLRSPAPEMRTFVQPPPSSKPPVRTFLGSGGLPFATSQHPSISLGSARPLDAQAAQPASFGSPMVHVPFRPVHCPPSVLTSPPPPFGIAFNMMQQRPPAIPTGQLAANTVHGNFGPTNCMPGMLNQQREFTDASSKPMVFNPTQPPPKLPFTRPACGASAQAFSAVSRVVQNPASTASTLVRGTSCQQSSHASLPFNPKQRPPGPQKPSPVFGTPWMRDPWHAPATSPRPTRLWPAPSTPPQLRGDMWQSRDIWQPQASGTPSCTSWQVSSSSWRLPSTSQQSVGMLSNPVWQSCDQSLGPGRPGVMQFDMLRLRSPPPPPQSSSESSFFR